MARSKKPAPTPKLKKDGTPYPSSTGRRRPRADQTTWREKLQQSRIKFDDDQKLIFLEHLSETGLKGSAARIAGVSLACVKNHLDNDPEFADEYDHALEDYADKIADEVKRRGQVGWEEPVFFKGQRVTEPVLNKDGTEALNEEGKPILRYVTVTKFSDRLLELEAKKSNPAYREKQTIDLNASGGGVLVAPAGKTPEEEIELAERLNAEATAKREQQAREEKK